MQNAPKIIPMTEPEGRRLLIEAGDDQPFFRLCPLMETQTNLTFCGVASACVVANALPAEKPVSASHGRYRRMTQDNFFSSRADSVCPRSSVEKGGMPLSQFAAALAALNFPNSYRHAAEDSVDSFRGVVRSTAQNTNVYIVLNYGRKYLGQEGTGHISPLGAYHEQRDLCLIMDVATYRYPFVWVQTEDLFGAMDTKDGDTEKSRGYVVVGSSAEDVESVLR